jgi:hypothetical protein
VLNRRRAEDDLKALIAAHVGEEDEMPTIEGAEAA